MSRKGVVPGQDTREKSKGLHLAQLLVVKVKCGGNKKLIWNPLKNSGRRRSLKGNEFSIVHKPECTIHILFNVSEGPVGEHEHSHGKTVNRPTKGMRHRQQLKDRVNARGKFLPVSGVGPVFGEGDNGIKETEPVIAKQLKQRKCSRKGGGRGVQKGCMG